jgi:hypothetical protein
VRAAGMKAYAMVVTNRDTGLLVAGYLDWSQLDDEIAIVPVNGKEIFLDPGERYCEFGELHWKHAFVQGVRQMENGGTEIAGSGNTSYKDTQIGRIAELKMDDDGKLQGFIRMTFTGSEALRWRQHILRTDQEQTKKDFEEELQKEVPVGVIVKTNHFLGATDYNSPLMVLVDVSGSLGTATGKRVFLPGTFFEAGSKSLFVQEKRENPVDLHFPYVVRDGVRLTLPTGFTVESVPKDAEIPLPHFADYVVKYGEANNTYSYSRLMAMANILYTSKEYPQLKDFFAKANVQDEQQAVLHVAAATAKGQ